ncbi:alpha/beta hydrolase fold domain-containing protein [Companilactobacillus baiquanensis]|uniref:Alpha/beta hydrolase fold domain-containing protein n=1 Tax=Companilactobacillus baiquanensis TaxID=2486005 RepID=A0ABW1UV31_9LACO|nr:alpha/beta hydrolase fold domain-containing protein [Companilactobacillus baiquanensis]
MLKNDYDTELSRLKQIEASDVPRLERVKMVVKDRVDVHSYEPHTFELLKELGDDPVLSNNLDMLRAGTVAEGVVDISSNDVNVEPKYMSELDQKVRYYRIYRPESLGKNKALIYIHGGSYYGGSPSDSLVSLKLLASQYDGVIYSVDYRLAPENPYPLGLMDCLSVLKMVAKTKTNITVGGDSAGASMALGVSELSHYMGIYDVDSQVLFYPTVVHGSDLEGSLWNDKKIPIVDEQRNVLHNSYTLFKQLDTKMTQLYMPDEPIDYRSPIVSPLYADPAIFKKVLVMTGEFDPFRLQDEAFLSKLGMAGCDAKYIRYGGMGHAFLNLVGKAAATEDAIHECAKFLEN